MVLKVAIISDSRGGFLQHFFIMNNTNANVIYRTFIHKGRGLQILWLFAMAKIESGEFDRVYIMGGICDITSPIYCNNTRYFWPLGQLNDLINSLVNSLVEITQETLSRKLYGKVVFLPELGADLIAYNQIQNPMPWMLACQDDLRANLSFLFNSFKYANYCLGARTPWLIDVIFGRTKKGELYPRYELLYDGLHPTPQTAQKYAKQIMKDVNEFLGSNL